jgi:DNA-binding response OmpR family regulator
MNVLIVDDDILLGQSLSRVLRRLGHDVRVASTIGEALPLLATQRPGVLLTDISLGEEWDGIDLACWAAFAYGTPIVVMTGGDRELARARLVHAGLSGVTVLEKPLSLEALVDEIAWNDVDATVPFAVASRRH